ncbi:hypothetical protein G3N55_06240 [Dissulfurirhabdus thermomarina]|uniref:Uncharacterized protein n=1 Tax=Dissulfurirhabdus thermomarina TaxID=1765737 RepID=A0A6N9TMC5_DISTH|nr:TraR/DksA C4-type zinc finger protein [Dissulfurirhabdus thermomarina]NDY42441.1 hypothetical protein [Dissulfurirhabdus thermomarina]NMX23377.1 hypothetical protein [Dissulfurirhabdus thermomarina]
MPGDRPPVSAEIPEAELDRLRRDLVARREALWEEIRADLLQNARAEFHDRIRAAATLDDIHDVAPGGGSLLGIFEARKARLEEITAALHRIEAGTFGRCTDCGRRIEADDLRDRPWEPRCAGCRAKAAEAEGGEGEDAG